MKHAERRTLNGNGDGYSDVGNGRKALTLARAEFELTLADNLVKLNTADTRVIVTAPFGRTAVHPMHLDADRQTQAQMDA